MARTVRPLSDNQIKKAKPQEKDYKLFDGRGLFLLVKTNGGKFWRAKYRYDGKEKSISFGKYPTVSLAGARVKLEQIKVDLENGINPTEKKKQKSIDQEVKNIVTFKNMALQFLEFKSQELNYDYYLKQKRRLETYVYPAIGTIEVDKVTKSDIIQLIKNVPNIKTASTKKTTKNETSRILFNLLNQVFKWGIHNDLTINSAMQQIDKSSIIAKREIEHFKAITDEKEIRIIYKMIKEYQGDISTKNALMFLALSGLRSGNIRGLRWDMIDFKKGRIVFAAKDMKTKQEFRLPISKDIEIILEGMREFTADRSYVFCSMLSKNKPLSENTLGYALKRMDITNHTPHGFRSSFSTLCYEYQKEHGFSSEVIESQLAHAVGGTVKLAYLRSDFFDDRLELMEWWAKFLDS